LGAFALRPFSPPRFRPRGPPLVPPNAGWAGDLEEASLSVEVLFCLGPCPPRFLYGRFLPLSACPLDLGFPLALRLRKQVSPFCLSWDLAALRPCSVFYWNRFPTVLGPGSPAGSPYPPFFWAPLIPFQPPNYPPRSPFSTQIRQFTFPFRHYFPFFFCKPFCLNYRFVHPLYSPHSWSDARPIFKDGPSPPVPVTTGSEVISPF